MGSGLYSTKLTYKQWYDFNNAQRAHYNFVEFAPSTFIWILIAGIYFPIPAAALGFGVFIARLIFSLGYRNSGPSGRLFGAAANDLLLLGEMGLAVASGIMFIRGEQP